MRKNNIAALKTMRSTRREEKIEESNKGDFRKVSATLPPDLFEKLVTESARRKIAGEPKPLISAIIRDAVERYLEKS
jgi:hypothetical protein